MQKSLKSKIAELSLASTSTDNQPHILFSIKSTNIAQILLNRPKVMNAFSFDMYFTFVQCIEKANQMAEVKYIVIRGAGGNFSSGNDLGNFMREELADLDKRVGATIMADVLERLTIAIVRSRKPIFAVVEGKAVGFAFTQLALYDKVFATENSYFMAPLVKIAQGPQMASSYLFPKIFSQPLAQQLIIHGKLISPSKLASFNFLSCHPSIQSANSALEAHIAEIEQLNWASYLQARKLMRLPDQQAILKANRIECQNLVERWTNPELPNLLVKYMANRKNKSKL